MQRLAKLDLNLLVPLDALLRERSVTRAAASLGLSQPALSASLSRLRRHFGDELLVRVGNGYELTPLAVALRHRVGVALTGAERVFASEPGFDPATARRDFALLSSDYPMAVLGARVAAILAEHAPKVRIRFQHQTPGVVESAEEALRGVDGLIFPHGFLFGIPHLDLYPTPGSVWSPRTTPRPPSPRLTASCRSSGCSRRSRSWSRASWHCPTSSPEQTGSP